MLAERYYCIIKNRYDSRAYQVAGRVIESAVVTRPASFAGAAIHHIFTFLTCSCNIPRVS